MEGIVSQTSSRTPFVYLYADDEGIESLYAQTTDRVETELTESRSKMGRGEVRLKVGFGNFLTTLLGLKEAAGSTKLETVRGQIEEAKSRLSVEHKLERLSQYLVESRQCYQDLYEAAHNASEPGRPVFIRIEEKFDAPDFYIGGGGTEAINSSKSIIFTIENRYEDSDRYFKRQHFRFIMPASLENFRRGKGFMRATSHEAIAFRGLKGEQIPLGVFGYLIRHNSTVCQIKSYAIWLMGGFK
jgi:hypothetical protein